MSRKGNKLISIPNNINVELMQNNINLKSGQNSLSISYPNDQLSVEKQDNNLKISILNNADKNASVFHGTIASHVINAIKGLSTGFNINLKIVGVGYKANVAGDKLNLAIGFSHPVVLNIPNTLKVVCPSPTEINISGFDKQVVGQFAALVRNIRPPEPYNGKGIMYSDEVLIRKVGKTAESSSGGAGGAGGGKK